MAVKNELKKLRLAAYFKVHMEDIFHPEEEHTTQEV